MVDIPNNPELAAEIRASAERLGVSPVDLATVISYETKGTFDPKIKGPTTKWGQHIGLIQPGEVQRERYGINPDAPLPDQFAGIERYLQSSGLKPGMGLLDLYSTINAGSPGRYTASDAASGGAPGTVADKVRSMSAHSVRARALLGEPIAPGAAAPVSARAAVPGPVPNAAAPAGAAPFGMAPDTAADDQAFAQVMELMKRATAANEETALPPALAPLRVGQMPSFGAARVRRRV